MEIRHQLPAYSPITAKASLRAIAQALHLGDDPRPRLRALLEQVYDADSVLLCGSGTQALTIAIREARKGVDRASPVALPAFSCFDVASAAVGADVRIALYDLDPDTLGPDLESLERVLRTGVAVVVIAPLYGLPVDWEELSTLAAHYGAVLIEDAAQGSGAVWKGRQLGSLGDISILSFGRGKGWTGGGGGAVLFRGQTEGNPFRVQDPEFVREASTALALGTQWAFGRRALYGVPLSVPGLGLGETKYRSPVPERSISRAAASALITSKAAADREAQQRRSHARQLLEAIEELRGISTMSVRRGGEPGYLRLPVRLDGGIGSLQSEGSARRLGIAPSYPRSLNELHEVATRLDRSEEKWPGANALVSELITLPTHSQVGPRDFFEIVGVLDLRRSGLRPA